MTAAAKRTTYGWTAAHLKEGTATALTANNVRCNMDVSANEISMEATDSETGFKYVVRINRWTGQVMTGMGATWRDARAEVGWSA